MVQGFGTGSYLKKKKSGPFVPSTWVLVCTGSSKYVWGPRG